MKPFLDWRTVQPLSWEVEHEHIYLLQGSLKKGAVNVRLWKRTAPVFSRPGLLVAEELLQKYPIFFVEEVHYDLLSRSLAWDLQNWAEGEILSPLEIMAKRFHEREIM